MDRRRILAFGVYGVAGVFLSHRSSHGDQPMSRRDAFGASLGRVVLWYGDGAESAVNLARVLRQDNGLNIVAIPGGPSGQAEMFINRRGIYGPYSQTKISDGLLAGQALTFAKEHSLLSD